MTSGSEDKRILEQIDARLRTILPEQYRDSGANVRPISMGSAALRFKSDGTVAWDEMWATFCDLAIAGGPPHKGALLVPGCQRDIVANSERFAQVVAEICRGITLVTGLDAQPSQTLGWVRVGCPDHTSAKWLARSITMENVSVRSVGAVLEVPAGPGYRPEKEIKNVITVVAKTCHYWFDHMGATQQQAVAALFVQMDLEAPLIQPAFVSQDFRIERHKLLFDIISDFIYQKTGLETSLHRYVGWLGLDCIRVDAAIWMMRAMVVSNVLARREDTVLFIPVNPVSDSTGQSVVRTVARLHSLAAAKQIF